MSSVYLNGVGGAIFPSGMNVVTDDGLMPLELDFDVAEGGGIAFDDGSAFAQEDHTSPPTVADERTREAIAGWKPSKSWKEMDKGERDLVIEIFSQSGKSAWASAVARATRALTFGRVYVYAHRLRSDPSWWVRHDSDDERLAIVDLALRVHEDDEDAAGADMKLTVKTMRAYAERVFARRNGVGAGIDPEDPTRSRPMLYSDHLMMLEAQSVIESSLPRLPHKMQQVLRYRYYGYGNRPSPFDSVGEQMGGMPPENIRQIEMGAFRLLQRRMRFLARYEGEIER